MTEQKSAAAIYLDAFAKLTPEERQQALIDQEHFGRAVIQTDANGNVRLLRPDAIVLGRDMSWNKP